MADKSFGVKELNLISASGTPTITSPNSVNINATNVAISTDITVGGMVSLGAGTSISSPGTNVLTFGTNSTEKVRITSAGDVGIGTDNPASRLDVRNASGTDPLLSLHHSNVDVTGEVIRIGRTDLPTIRYHSIKAFHSGGASSNSITFHLHDGSSATSQSEILRLRGDGNVVIDDGNLILASGHGIDFSATAQASGMTSELLDDYEEGTWTPTSGTRMGTLSNANGTYVRIGNTVTVNYFFTTSSVSTSDSSLIGGLPYTVTDSISGTSVEATGVCFQDDRMYLCFPTGNSTNIAFETDRPIQGSTSSGTQTLRGSVTYLL